MSTEPMSAKELFDACMRQAEFEEGVNDNRSRLEWHLSINLWAVMVAGIATLPKGALPDWAVFMVVFVHGFWVVFMRIDTFGTTERLVHYRKQAEQLLDDHKHVVKLYEGGDFRLGGEGILLIAKSLVQLLITIVLAFLMIHFNA
jgi:hypothetical protein